MRILALFLILTCSSGAMATQTLDYQIKWINGQRVIIPVLRQKKELKGTGLTFVEKVQEEDGVNEKGEKIKRQFVWRRNCGKIFFQDKENLPKKGDSVRFRLDGDNCSISSWEKF